MIIGVIGAGECSREDYKLAYEVGRQIARRGAMLVCGGLGGIMEAVSHGARDEGGTTVGILPGSKKEDANKYIDIPIVTNAGHMRNVIIVNTADAIIAVTGNYGTLSEIAIALKLNKRVIGLKTWEIEGVVPVNTAIDAVSAAMGS